MSFSPSQLLTAIESNLPVGASGQLCVAFSGGLDSTVLLHALARSFAGVGRLRAVHINHQLQSRSSEWEHHCSEAARKLGIDFESRRVAVATNAETGPEAAARDARYAALRDSLRPGETLLTAHHADDQLETVLLALARGAGLQGLAAMPACQRFGRGWHLRPLLGFARADLEVWARAEDLIWMDDPTNDHVQLSRNFLRHELVPGLRKRWPAIAASAVRSAAHLGEATQLLDDLAQIDLEATETNACLRVDSLAALTPARRRNLLRYWVRSLGARAPSTRKLASLEHDMLMAQDDRLPVVGWDGFEVRRYRGLLYARWGPQLPKISEPVADWDWQQQPLRLPDDLGWLRTEKAREGGLAKARLPRQLTVEFRRGGEALRPAGSAHQRKLKKLLQDADILPWWRNRLPLIRIGGALAAVGDLWIADEFAARSGEEGTAIVWESRPQIKAISL